MRFAPVIALVCLVAACGGADDRVSRLNYLTFGRGESGLVASVKQANIRVCLDGARLDEGAWSKNIQSVILKWIEPMRALTSDPLATDVQVVDSRQQCDATVTVSPGVWANTNVGRNPTINMAADGYFASYNVLLHEFGHGFALGDTYQGGQSGNCQPGQPQSVMCNTRFDVPQKDDIDGLTEIFGDTFPGDKPRTLPPEDFARQIHLALGKESAPNTYALYGSVDGAGADNAGSFAYCVGERTSCGPTAIWTQLGAAGSRGSLPIFASKSDVTLKDGLHLTVRYLTDTTVTFHSIGFSATNSNTP